MRLSLRPGKLYQWLPLACLLTFSGGFIDAYTFINRGQTLVGGQTGNVVFLSVELIHQNLIGAEVKLASGLAFMAGILLVSLLRTRLHGDFWRLMTILPMMIGCFTVGFLSTDIPNIYIVPPLSFASGMLTTAFGEAEDLDYNNAFMTGNIKKTMMALGAFLTNPNAQTLKNSLVFFCLITSFASGAISSAFLIKSLKDGTIHIATGVLTLAFFLYASLIYTHKSNQKQ